MKKSYLISLVKTLTPNEWSNLKFFIFSDNQNNGPFILEVQKLFVAIESASPNFTAADLNKIKIYKDIFPGKPFVEGKIEKVMTELNKKIRTFLLSEHYFSETNYFNQNFDLAKLLRERGDDVHYLQIISRLEGYLENEKFKMQDYFHKKYLLENEKHDWHSYNNKHKGDINLSETIRNLDLFYYTNRFELLNMFLLQKMSTKLEVPGFITHLLENSSLPAYYNDLSPNLIILNKIFLLLNIASPSLNDFIELNNLINKHEDKVDALSLRGFNAYLRSICVLLCHSGQNEFEPMLFKLQKEHLEKGYLYYQGKLHINTFYNVVNNGIRQKEYDWVIKFIEGNKNLIIGENETKDYYRLNLALYYTSIKRFNDAIDILPQSFSDPIYNNVARRLELKIYYETNSSLLAYKIDSFKMFILRSSRKYLPAQEREQQSNFINLLLQLTQSLPKDQTRSERLIKRINAKKFVADREWLLEKAAELGNKTKK